MTPLVLVVGATGYVGGRLVPRLLEAGYHVRAISRSIDKLKNRPWALHPHVTLCAVDVMDPAALNKVMAGVTHIYYLVHSMNPSHRDFEKADRQAAQNMIAAADTAGVKQLIYLGGLGDTQPHAKLSKHLQSRAEVGRILQSGQTPVTILRAAMIIGSGSASFEILRYIVERLPVMLLPRWVHTPSQPIAIRNVLQYLMGCLDNPETFNQTFDIGGRDILTYLDLMKAYARCAGLPPRWMVVTPFFTPSISSIWIGLITPVPNYISRPLAEGLRNPVVCLDNRIQTLVPQNLLGVEEAIQLAITRIRENEVTSHWTDAGQMPPSAAPYPGDPQWSGGTLYRDEREILIEGDVQAVWKPVIEIGGESGYYTSQLLWQLRGILDLFFGGVGYGRGRKDPHNVAVGDALDCWRVLKVDPPNRLVLMAEMKVPGEAYLEYRLSQLDEDTVSLVQCAYFKPKGLLGLLYWRLVTPLHHIVFNGMLEGIANTCHRAVVKAPVHRG